MKEVLLVSEPRIPKVDLSINDTRQKRKPFGFYHPAGSRSRLPTVFLSLTKSFGTYGGDFSLFNENIRDLFFEPKGGGGMR